MNEANLQMLESAALHLEELADEVVFVGGATVELWITDTAAPEFRPTHDIDVIVEIASRVEYYRLEERLAGKGFLNHAEGGIICRFKHRDSGVILDAMPTESVILGFTNDWQKKAFHEALTVELPSGTKIRVISPPYLIATKLAAFGSRGNHDFYESKDFEDVVTLIDGRDELVREITQGPSELLRFAASELLRLSRLPNFESGLEGALPMSPESKERLEQVIQPRIQSIIKAGDPEWV